MSVWLTHYVPFYMLVVLVTWLQTGGFKPSAVVTSIGAAAGLASLPVFLQWRADAYADLLAISGPLWLTWFVVVSVRAGLGRT